MSEYEKNQFHFFLNKDNTHLNFIKERKIKEIENPTMEKNDEKNSFLKLNTTKINFYIKAALIGVLRGGVGLIWEHPFDSIKTQWQANLQIKNSSEILKFIYFEKGFIGFYRGFVPNLIRQSSKNFYRWPLMLYLPNFYRNINEKILGFLFKNKEAIAKIQTGLTIANIETLFITPFERLKIYFMTHKTIETRRYSLLYYFYNLNKGNIFKELFKGLEPSLYRSNISWVTFLLLDHEAKKIVKTHKNIEQLSFLDLFFVSIVVGFGNLAATMPFDFVKTQCQKDSNLNDSCLKILRGYYKEYGLKALYIGWQFKSLQYLFQSIITVSTLDYLENKAKKLR